MRLRLGHSCDASATVFLVAQRLRRRAAGVELPQAWAIAIYFGGVLVETLGLRPQAPVMCLSLRLGGFPREPWQT